MEEVTRIVTKREMSQTRAERERKREKGGNMNEDDEGYLPASQDAAPTQSGCTWFIRIHGLTFRMLYRRLPEAFMIYR